ncbi:MAG TPA: LysR family transcriptional regulator substrate-binding protein, partial [Microlunatus sp.]|nr:LysR family transcriptional regulator substrate-binding protein [Microlunatus sp.]
VAELAAGLIPSLRLAASPLVVSLVVAPSIAELGPDDACPRIVTDPDLSYDRLDCDVDLVLATTPPAPGLDRLRFPRLPITAQLPADHFLAAQDEIGLAQLAGENLVLAADSGHVQTRLTGLLAVSGLTPATASTVDTGQLAQALAAAGRGVAVVTDEPRFDLVAVPITTDDQASLAVEVYAAWKPEHHAAPMVAACARRLQRSTAARLDRRRAIRAQRAESAA